MVDKKKRPNQTVVVISKDKCIGCGLCVDECPFEALYLEDGVATVDESTCTGCAACTKVCPTEALEVPGRKALKAERRKEREMEISKRPQIKEYKGVWVFIELEGREVAPVSWELMGAGRKLADDLGVELAGVILGKDLEDAAREAITKGADRVYVIEHPSLERYRTTPYTDVLVELVNRHKPEIFLMGATTLGRDLSGAVATRLGTGLTADCTVLAIDDETRLLKQTRPAFGGNIMACIICRNHRPQMATVRPRVMAEAVRDEGRTGEIVREEFNINEEDLPTKILEVIEEPGKSLYLDRAEVIVAGGRGLGDASGFEVLRELADVLGGSLGASRAAVEAGWISADHQVGQTGITVRPRVYFAVGISGAIQHLVGMETSDVIVAINTDPHAPIFSIATFGIVGDYREVVPAIARKFREKLGQSSDVDMVKVYQEDAARRKEHGSTEAWEPAPAEGGDRG